ncbi:MAG: PHP-associated domain-containing protein [Anaerolineales bacterium]
MLTIEFHCHTIYSKDSLLSVKTLLDTAQRKRIDRLVITDHNTIAGAVLAKEMAPERVIVGEEIVTQAGELLCAFVKEKIPPGLPYLEAISLLRQQEAYISVAHPFDTMRKAQWSRAQLMEIAPLVDAIEVFNSRCFRAEFNRTAEDFARQNSIAGTVGSDAHTAMELGRARMKLPSFSDTESFKTAITDAQFKTSLSSPLIHFTSRYATWRKAMFSQTTLPKA